MFDSENDREDPIVGEAEDMVLRRNQTEQRKRQALAAYAAAEEAEYIRGKLRRMLPRAVANLRKRNYDVPGAQWVTVDGERRAAWPLTSVNPHGADWEYRDHKVWYLLADGAIVMVYLGVVTRQTTVPNLGALVSLDNIIRHPRRKPVPIVQDVRHMLRKY
jgi:hypothetical protein